MVVTEDPAYNTSTGSAGKLQNWLSSWARGWNIPNQSQPNPCSPGDVSPCILAPIPVSDNALPGSAASGVVAAGRRHSAADLGTDACRARAVGKRVILRRLRRRPRPLSLLALLPPQDAVEHRHRREDGPDGERGDHVVYALPPAADSAVDRPRGRPDDGGGSGQRTPRHRPQQTPPIIILTTEVTNTKASLPSSAAIFSGKFGV